MTENSPINCALGKKGTKTSTSKRKRDASSDSEQQRAADGPVRKSARLLEKSRAAGNSQKEKGDAPGVTNTEADIDLRQNNQGNLLPHVQDGFIGGENGNRGVANRAFSDILIPASTTQMASLHADGYRSVVFVPRQAAAEALERARGQHLPVVVERTFMRGYRVGPNGTIDVRFPPNTVHLNDGDGCAGRNGQHADRHDAPGVLQPRPRALQAIDLEQERLRTEILREQTEQQIQRTLQEQMRWFATRALMGAQVQGEGLRVLRDRIRRRRAELVVATRATFQQAALIGAIPPRAPLYLEYDIAERLNEDVEDEEGENVGRRLNVVELP